MQRCYLDILTGYDFAIDLHALDGDNCKIFNVSVDCIVHTCLLVVHEKLLLSASCFGVRFAAADVCPLK